MIFNSHAGIRGIRILWLLLAIDLTASGCASSGYLMARRAPRNPLAGALGLFSKSGPHVTPRTEQVLRRYDLLKQASENPEQSLALLHEEVEREPTAEKVHAYAELTYVNGVRAEKAGDDNRALDYYGSSVAHAYYYLFDPRFDRSRNPYDPQFRQACDLYNVSLEAALRIVQKQGKLHPAAQHTIQVGDEELALKIVLRGPWQADEIEKIEFVSDYEATGFTNRYRTYGLGVPLIAVRNHDVKSDAAAEYYPPGLSFPVTAFLRVQSETSRALKQHRTCVLELYDPLAVSNIQIAHRQVPLETDLSTPLGYFLDQPTFQDSHLATWGLLDPSSTNDFSGIYMLDAYEPNKIPVLMVHGLWSSPRTWIQMVNDLRALPEIRDHFQFWTYLYPTGQPFWISATQMRHQVEELRTKLDPEGRVLPLDQMVLIGHSMGGLVSRLQTIESGDAFWRVISDRPFMDLQASEEDRGRLANVLFFRPNRSVRRCITIGTPHRGSEYANDYTRYAARRLIELPKTVTGTGRKLVRDNPRLFRNTDMLTISNSIDSLAPDSPILPVMLSAPKAPWVRFHNIVGVVDKEGIVGSIAGEGDGVVEFQSAHMEDVESELVVQADHITVHQHPLSILEVRRILLNHLDQALAEWSSEPRAIPADYRQPLGPLNQRVSPDPASPRRLPAFQQNTPSPEMQLTP